MLYWSAVFFVIALISALLGFTGLAVATASVAKVLFLIFIVLFLAALIASLLGARRPRPRRSSFSIPPKEAP